MSAKKEVDVCQLLADRFFGPTFMEQEALVDSIIACRSLSDFKKLKVDFSSRAVLDIHEAASLVDNSSKKLTKERLKEIFDNIKAVRGNSAAVFL